MVKNYTLHDVVEYTLALLPGEKINLSANRGQRAFHNLREKCPDFFPDLMFDKNGHIPYSEELEEQFQLMISTGILELTWLNGVYGFDQKMKSHILEELSGKFSEEEKNEMKKMSESLKDSIVKKSYF